MTNMPNLAAARAALPLDLRSVHIQDSYWNRYVELIRTTVIPYQWEALNDRVPDAEPSHAIRNFRIAAGLEEGEFGGFFFQDTDLYKWLEAVGYSLAGHPDADLEKVADEAIELIAGAQLDDGYVNTYFTVAKPGDRWTNLLDCHEMYSAGHLIEGAVAYYHGTGKTRFLDVARRLADHIDERFGPNPGQLRGYDGHQELELALVKLYEATGERRYLELASFQIEERGQEPNYLVAEWEKRGRISPWNPGAVQKSVNMAYHQAHKPVREQEIAIGHAVRAVYMYTAMADLALHKGDAGLLAACKRLWSNMTNKQMYVNGSIGSTHHGEAFTFDYDLPNDTNYSETCASIGLIFFARRMLQLEPKGEYADVMERALYNTVTAGIAGDGKHYFYVNPMEVWPAASEGNPGKHHVKAVRQKWYGCACCPPNVARLLSSLGHYIYTANEDTLYAHLYIGSEATHSLGGKQVTLSQKSGLPWAGDASFTVAAIGAVGAVQGGVEAGAATFTLALRVPSWSKATSFTLNGQPVQPEVTDGYARLTREWRVGDTFAISLDMEPRRVYSHSQLRANAGRVALQRGPLVYAFEETDNGAPLASLSLPRAAELRPVPSDWRSDIVLLEMDGVRLSGAEDSLYSGEPPIATPQKLVAIPYTLWGNRKPGEMSVWLRETP